MRRSDLVLGAVSLLCSLVACSDNQPMALYIGAEGGPCTAGGGCDPGLICLSRLCVRPADSALPPAGGGAGGSGPGGQGGSGGQPGSGGQAGSGGSGAPDSAANGGAGGGLPVDVGFADEIGAGGTAGRGGATGGTGGIIPTGGAMVTGGVKATGGARATGGTVSTGGVSTGGAGGAVCTDVVPCGGDVVGSWTVISSCLQVSGQLDMSLVGLSCPYAAVTGTLKVTGTWSATANGTYADRTTTTGSEQITLPAACLVISGVTVACERVSTALQALGYSAVSCAGLANGQCSCSATVQQAGGMGLVSYYAQTSGTYKTAANVLTTDIDEQYSYCVSGNKMTWTPRSTNPTVTGTIVLQSGGAAGSGGAFTTGGASGGGGVRATGGAAGTGGSAGAGGATTAAGPCDIFAADGGPCVAAHSTVRRLASTYAGPLYQVRVGGSKTGTGGTVADIGFLADGFADSAAQDAACGTDACTISVIYDQSGLGNHLTVAPAGGAKRTPDNEANAKALPVTLSGHKVYGVHIVPGLGYRNNLAVGTATGDDAETIYMVASSDFYNGGCCFDYGNAETNSLDNGEGAAEAVYFGNCTIWNKGAGDGPWVMADLENGLWAGNTSPYEPNQSVPGSWKYVTGMVKGDGPGKNHWALKVGNAQSGLLTTPFDGVRPSTRYNPMRKEGGIMLGTAGDNSNGAQGNFFEGVMTAHYSSNEADDSVQANVVAAYQ